MTDRSADLDFLIFAHARSGSDSLCAALDRHPSIHVCNEPFNPKHHLWDDANLDYRASVVDEDSLYAEIRRIRTRYSAIKTLDWNLPKNLNESLLGDEAVPLVLLRRRNALQAVVSHWLARTTHIWQLWDLTALTSSRYRDLPPAPMATIEESLRDFLRLREDTDRAVSHRTTSSLTRVWHEDLYTGSVPHRRSAFAQLTSFLGYPELGYDQVEDLLGPKGKLNTSDTYSSIPNANEVNEAFGSDETGWLLRSSGLHDRSTRPPLQASVHGQDGAAASR
jgi:hypothetical protein